MAFALEDVLDLRVMEVNMEVNPQIRQEWLTLAKRGADFLPEVLIGLHRARP